MRTRKIDEATTAKVNDSQPSNAPVEELTYREILSQLKKRGLNTRGKKDVVTQRLRDALAAEKKEVRTATGEEKPTAKVNELQPSNAPVEELTFHEIQSQLKKRGLNTRGKKDVVTQRLREALRTATGEEKPGKIEIVRPTISESVDFVTTKKVDKTSSTLKDTALSRAGSLTTEAPFSEGAPNPDQESSARFSFHDSASAEKKEVRNATGEQKPGEVEIVRPTISESVDFVMTKKVDKTSSTLKGTALSRTGSLTTEAPFSEGAPNPDQESSAGFSSNNSASAVSALPSDKSPKKSSVFDIFWRRFTPHRKGSKEEKEIPFRFEKNQLDRAMQAQFLVNPENIFGEIQPCNIEKMFDNDLKTMKNGRRSGEWNNGDQLTIEEKKAYNCAMMYDYKM